MLDNPDELSTRQVAKDGRLWLGEDFAGEEVRYAVKIVPDEDDG